MDIRDWPLDQIMQLPDCMFGRRFSICVEAKSVDSAMSWDISEIAFPERCVLWEVVITMIGVPLAVLFESLRLALGDQLPTSNAMMNALEPLVPGLGIQGPEPRYIGGLTIYQAYHMRNPIYAQGRRLVVEVISPVTKMSRAQVVCEVSSVPREVPDCLISEYLRSQ